MRGKPYAFRQKCNTPEGSQKTNKTWREKCTEAFGADELSSIAPYCPPHHLDTACCQKESDDFRQKALRGDSNKYLVIVTYIWCPRV